MLRLALQKAELAHAQLIGSWMVLIENLLLSRMLGEQCRRPSGSSYICKWDEKQRVGN